MVSCGVVGSSLLDKIDRLFECNVGELVSLPQIVVVGDQSSGKSSVLEGLTGLPFPRESGLCTRFATQITFRRSKAPGISVSIIPAKNSNLEDKVKLHGWKKSDLDSLNPTTFANIMAEVVQKMGIGCPEEGTSKTFSNNVLRLEIAGPDQEHFSVIDVPGIFKRTTSGLTTKDDMAMVDGMVNEYMSNPRSVMLIVVPCNVDIATQEILERAEDLDPEGIRTFGILTKPDLMDKGSEDSAISLVEGKTHQLRLGWHILRNPGQSELSCSPKERLDLEKNFFSHEHPWSTLDEGKLGIEPLRDRLQEILGDHVRREFPKVKAEISQMLKQAERTLKSLGLKRQSQTEQCQYLMDMALAFQNVVSHAVHSDYSRSNILTANKKLRIATEAVNRGQKFADAMERYGQTYDFMSYAETLNKMEVNSETNYTDGIREEGEREEEEGVVEDDVEEEEGITDDDPDSIPDFADAGSVTADIDIRMEDDHIDIQDVVHKNTRVSLRNSEEIFLWLKKEYRESRGFELGTFDASLLSVTMKQQAAKWRDLALGYISDIISLVHSFILGVLDYVTPNDRVREGIRTYLLDEITKMYQHAMSQTEFLVSVELDGTPATYNRYFNETLEKLRQRRLRLRLQNCAFTHQKLGEVVRLNDIIQRHSLSSEDHAVLEIHDILSSYYTVARKRFVDCVRMQVADTLLVTGSQTPLTLFSARFVTNMTREALEDVAGEDAIMKRRRDDLEKKIARLHEGKRIVG
ncbi:dynamin GTPase [Polyplosphaeria fusca]|uniref:Dynamin GTPase n=1 Tax=Polyplosphaeria fusca TaxID=682080 RepID=A0A9P4R3S2_9PLEO|nr:dynamin GTPase [Polyplosphaeria fusca]